MKQYLSILTLLVHSSIYKLCILLAGVAAVHTLLFSLWSSRILVMMPLFAAGLWILIWILTRNWVETSSRQSYTLQRLSLSERNIVLLQTIYNLFCLLLFWGAHLITACLLYSRICTGSQDLFLEFSGNAYLHSLMPGADWLSWLKNLFVLTSTAFSMALYPSWKRNSMKKDNGIMLFLIGWWVVAFFIDSMNISQIFLALFWSIYIPVLMIRDIKNKEAEKI